MTTTIEVRRDDLSKARAVSGPSPSAATGLLLAIERFAFTANNVTYGVVGDQLGYWRFFPSSHRDWGIIPVWGVARVVESRIDEIKQGERLYGYFPMASHFVMEAPDKIRPARLIDGAAHRAGLPAVYNAYQRLDAEPGYDKASDDARMLLWPLYATSFCLADYFSDKSWFGAEQIIVGSASSKTAIGVAYALSEIPGAPKTVGLTSARARPRVEALGLYDSVATYDGLDAIDATKPTAIVDMSGDGEVLAALHRRLGDKMRFTSNVGVTHAGAPRTASGYIRERSEFFFAPSHIEKRTKDWGPGEFDQRAFAFWKRAAERSRAWLNVERFEGADAALGAYERMRLGSFPPETGVILSL